MRLAGYFLLLVIVSFLVLAASLTPLFPIDDAYITFRYARNWTEGEGLVFNTGERVEAYSNFLWTALVAALAWLGLTPPLGARLLSWGALVSCSAVIGLLARRRIPDAPAVLHVAAGVAFLALPSTVFHALSGLETILTALLLLTFAWLIDLDIEARRRSVLIGVMLAAISIARPEGLLFSLLVLLALASLRVIVDQPPDVRLGVIVVACLILLTSFFGWRWFYYGDLLPNSVVAKSAGFHRSALAGGLVYIRKFALFYSPLLVLAVVSFVQARRDEILVLRVPVLCTYLAVTLLGGFADGYPYTRYLFPLVPLLLVWAFEGAWFICRTGWQIRGPVFGFLFSFFLAAVILVVQAFLSFAEYQLSGMPLDLGAFLARPASSIRTFFRPDSAPHTADGPLRDGLGHHYLAAWLEQHASRQDVLATYEIGIVPYYSRLPVIDLFGLADRRIAKSPGFPGARADLDYVFSRSPRYMACRVPSDCLCFYYPVFRSPEFRDGYDLVGVYQYWTTKWLLFERRNLPVYESRYWLGWDDSSDQPVTRGGTRGGRTVPIRIDGEVHFDPYLQLLEPLHKERLFLEILNRPQSDSGRDAMREWLETFRKAFVFLAEQDKSATRLDFDLVIPPDSILEFSLATRNETFSPGTQSFEVSVATAGDSETLFKRDFGESANLKPGWEKIRLDLGRFPEKQVRLSFSRSSSPRPLSIAIGEPRIIGSATGAISGLR